MARRKATNDQKVAKRQATPMDPDAREKYLINLSLNLVEQRLLDGTASSQETTHFLKLASRREQKELEKLEKDIALADSKIKTMESMQSAEKLFSDAISAFQKYSGTSNGSEG